VLPVLILIAVVIDHAATFFSRVADTYLFATRETWQTNKFALKLVPYLNRKNFYTGIMLFSLVFAFFAVPFFITPQQATTVQNFFQVMTNSGYEAIQWAKQNTQSNSVFMSDALYGWWFGGFAQRPTISAVEPQYLTLAREFEPAKAAKELLDTDYVISNGLIQVREDGGYISRHNPMFLANISSWSYFPYPFFNFKNNGITVTLSEGNNNELFTLSQLQVTEMHVENTSDWASIYVSKENDLFSYTQILTVYRGLLFVKMSVTFEPKVEDVAVDGVVFTLQSKGEPINYGLTVGFYDESAKVLGQLIFAEAQPTFHEDGPTLIYNFSKNSKAKLELWASAFSVSNALTTLDDPKTEAGLGVLIEGNLASYQKVPDNVTEFPNIEVFDYKKALADWNISYIAVRDSEILPKFANDPVFSLLFINNEVSIFLVKYGVHLGGTMQSR